MVRDMLSRLLRRDDYVVYEAADADAALQILESTPISVLLCDRKMPGRGGDWLIEQTRNRFPTTAIILATGDDAVPPRVILESGLVGYLVKPFTAETVRDVVRDAMVWCNVVRRNQRTT
jgi:two-component system, NtrC family, response regulator HupR/HoxA